MKESDLKHYLCILFKTLRNLQQIQLISSRISSHPITSSLGNLPGAGEAPGQVWQAATLQVAQQQVGSLLWAQVEAQVWPQKQASLEVVFTESAKGLAVATATTKRSLNMLPQGE